MLPASGTARVRALLTTHSEFSDITPTQYDSAYAWIRETGLASDLQSSEPAPRRVFESAVARSGAPWLPDADILVRGPAELPDDALRAAQVLGISEGDAYAQIRMAWGKVDTAERSRIGLAGELALVALLAASVQGRVDHVAARSDGHGYDIAVAADLACAHLEVKSTTRRARLTVYLSRNEFETMRHDPAWQLVALRLGQEMEPKAIATVPKEWITAQAPGDRNSYGRWESCRLDVPPGVPVPGIPSIASLLVEDSSELLTGAAGWPG
ncbi:DUF3883 domain-containing protein [Streptomyces sp. V4-01]|uniref:DUF3883 domain-containing protein n=1 Tax=Actinacidiphila polyblastidii TaxID=3110430 RepID=A0ABU7PFT9_9ACTN|nr:DUF3883 domain-containing protein [Streptomyces sp. V4-01]